MEKSRISTLKLTKLLDGYKERAECLKVLCEKGIINKVFPEIEEPDIYAYTIAENTIMLVNDIKRELKIE